MRLFCLSASQGLSACFTSTLLMPNSLDHSVSAPLHNNSFLAFATPLPALSRFSKLSAAISGIKPSRPVNRPNRLCQKALASQTLSSQKLSN